MFENFIPVLLVLAVAVVSLRTWVPLRAANRDLDRLEARFG